MYNADTAQRLTPPSGARLLVSTLFALVIAAALLITVILPSEYAIDPIGAGRLLGLTDMGEIKQQLAREAAADRENAQRSQSPAPAGAQPDQTARLERIERRLDEVARTLTAMQAAPKPVEAPQVAAAAPPAAVPRPAPEPVPATPRWRDEIEIVLQPGEGVEFKLVMQARAEARFEWSANGSVLNYDTHGDGGGNSISYEKGRGVPGQAGILRAAFNGNHGWFWRNRTRVPVTLTLRTRGAYALLKRTA